MFEERNRSRGAKQMPTLTSGPNWVRSCKIGGWRARFSSLVTQLVTPPKGRGQSEVTGDLSVTAMGF